MHVNTKNGMVNSKCKPVWSLFFLTDMFKAKDNYKFLPLQKNICETLLKSSSFVKKEPFFVPRIWTVSPRVTKTSAIYFDNDNWKLRDIFYLFCQCWKRTFDESILIWIKTCEEKKALSTRHYQQNRIL